MFAKFVGITAETAALIEAHRRGPGESEDDILRRALAPPDIAVTCGSRAHEPVNGSASPTFGCDLGQGAHLDEGENLYLFRYKESRDTRKPEAVAEAKGGNLYLYGKKVNSSKGSLLQPALRMVQERLNDQNPQGNFISLDAWSYWYVLRDQKYIKASILRDQKRIVRRGQNVTLEDLGLA